MSKGSYENVVKSLTIILTLCILGGLVFEGYALSQLQKQFSKLELQVQSQDQKKSIPTGNYVEESQIIDTVKKVQNSVVSIVASKDLPKYRNNPFFYNNLFNDPFFNQFFGNQQGQDQQQQNDEQNGKTEKVKIGGGSGFIYSEDGLVITNKHVVDDSDADYTVALFDGTELDAKVLAKDDVNDLAIVKIEAKKGEKLPKLEPVQLGNSKNIQVGQKVVAIGNALAEFQNTVTSGIISGKGRNIVASDGSFAGEQIKNLLQTDAAINPGNSGGPLVNLVGQVIGMNTAVAQQAQGIGFAIPVDDIKHFAEVVKKNGKYTRPYIGVHYMMLNEENAKKLNLKIQEGALLYGDVQQAVPAIINGSPADKAGLQMGDIILSVDGQKLTEDNDLRRAVLGKETGSKVRLEVLRNGEKRNIELKLEEYSPDTNKK